MVATACPNISMVRPAPSACILVLTTMPSTIWRRSTEFDRTIRSPTSTRAVTRRSSMMSAMSRLWSAMSETNSL